MVDRRIAWWMRSLNVAMDMAGFFRIDPTSLSWPALESAARRHSGVSTELDEEFSGEMQFLLDSILLGDDLSALGRVSTRWMIVSRLLTRLRLAHELREHPEIDDMPIRRPLFVVGLPRTGTTLLHRLLSLDPAGRALPLWQLMTPYTLDRSPAETARRIRFTQRSVRFSIAAAPGLRAMHDLDAHTPEECYYLLPHSPVHCYTSHYLQWLNQRDYRPDYQYFKQQLQALQWGHPERRWVLKSPCHLSALGALLAVFPDARIIQTHRDPATAVASLCSLMEGFTLLTRRRVDLAQIGQDTVTFWSEAMSRAAHVRRVGGSYCISDVYYDHLVADPIGTIENVYQQFDENLSPEGRSRMLGYLEHDSHGAHGAHRYSLDRYGLTNSDVIRAFAGTCPAEGGEGSPAR